MNTEQIEAQKAKFVTWVTTVWRPDDGAALLAKEWPRMEFAAWLASATASEGRIAEQAARINTLVRAGNKLANIAFNLKQPSQSLTDSARKCMADSQAEWDTACAALAGSATPSATKPKTLLTLNGYQLLEALDAAWPDRDTDHEQGDTEISFWMRDTAEVIDGELCEAGLYAYWSEYPEEGSFPLPPEPRAPAPVPQDTLKNADSEDAARYRWLRDKSIAQWAHPIVVSQELVFGRMSYLGPLSGEALNKAIDAARTAAIESERASMATKEAK